MRLLFASDSFKGTLTSRQIIDILGKAAREIFEECDFRGVSVADGGEGTAEAVIQARRGEKIYVNVHGPLMEQENVFYGKLSDTEAILEMAQSSGFLMVPLEKRNPWNTTTYGTGEMLKDALRRGFKDITIAIGGSATNDGGMGFASALGVRFYDKDGNILEGRGSDLGKVVHIDLSGIDPLVKNAKFTVMSDVTNPLCGADGATYTFGKQKGGTQEILDKLEQGMKNYRDVIIKEFGLNPDEIPGTGAAGGLGAALLIFLNAEIKSGIETVLDLIDFDDYLRDIDLVVTGEGRTDWQSSYGKVLQGVGERAARHNVPAVALSGGLGEGYEKIYQHGILSVFTTVDKPMSLEEALKNAEELYYKGAIRMFRFLKTGMQMNREKVEC